MNKNRINSIIIVGTLISVLGFASWYVMYMNDLKGSYNIDHIADSSEQTRELKDKGIEDSKERIQNNRLIDASNQIIDQETRPVYKRNGKRHKENGENTGEELNTQLPQEEKNAELEQGSEAGTGYLSLEDLDAEKKRDEIKFNHNKSMSLTQKDNTISITLKNENRPMESPQEPAGLQGKVNSNTQHPTSTIGQW